jgi:rubredoxin
MRRILVWVERPNFQGWACSECAWAFNPSGPPVDESIDDMKMHYEQQRDKEFKSHVCAEHPRTTKNPR